MTIKWLSHDRIGRVAELDILSTDLDRSSQRALMAEKELITLRTSYERQQQTLHDTAKV